jgi:triacylglycerol lipase
MRLAFAIAVLLLGAVAASPAHANHRPPPPPLGPLAGAHECVVVLHGMSRSAMYMKPVELSLRHAGYSVVNVSYPVRKKPIEELATLVDGYVQRCRDTGATRIHFVTHSLGGIVVRQWLHGHVLPEAGRFVMLGTPNGGSEIADRYKDDWWYRISTGPAGQEIGTGPDDLPHRLGPPPIETGVIAGTRAANRAYSEWLGGANDGKVSLASAHLDGIADFVTVDNSHYFLPRSAAALRQVRVFLATGRFEHLLAPAPAPTTTTARRHG